MANVLNTAEEWLRSVRQSHLLACDTWTTQYSRGLTAVGVDMTPAETRVQSDDGQTIINSRVTDWLIDRAELDGFGEPQQGDRITVIYDHATETYEVAAIAGEPAWRWHGRDGKTFRVHTVRV